MSTVSAPPKERFRLGMLIYDTRYRALTIQVAALFGFMLFFAWLIDNTITNLEILGKPVDFSFLFQPSGYDINQSFIEYSSQSTHLRAAVIGLMNTLLIAALGCTTATIIGVLVGVLRLSRNWLVARLMTAYVEWFRNVPVLLWIVFTMAVLIDTLPRPVAFRKGEASMLFDAVAITNRGVYIPEPLFSNSLGDIPVAGGVFYISGDLIALLVVLFAGIWAAHRVRLWADRVQEETGDRPVTWHYRTALIVLPPVIVLWWLGFHLGYPELKGFNFKGGIHLRNSLIALWLA
ncbi:MAG: amino acid ABC transporter permease, partial [Alphaproteobacteria bacterium]